MYTFPNWAFPLEFPCFKETWKKSLKGPIGIYLGLGKKQGLLEMAKLLNNPLLPLLLFPCWLYIKCFKLPTLYSNGYGLGSNPLYCRKFVKAQLEKRHWKNAGRKDSIKDFYWVARLWWIKTRGWLVIKRYSHSLNTNCFTLLNYVQDPFGFGLNL